MENKECVIKVEKLTKTYKIFNKPIDRIKEVLNPFRTKYSTEYHALKDITFSINKKLNKMVKFVRSKICV